MIHTHSWLNHQRWLAPESWSYFCPRSDTKEAASVIWMRPTTTSDIGHYMELGKVLSPLKPHLHREHPRFSDTVGSLVFIHWLSRYHWTPSVEGTMLLLISLKTQLFLKFSIFFLPNFCKTSSRALVRAPVGSHTWKSQKLKACTWRAVFRSLSLFWPLWVSRV